MFFEKLICFQTPELKVRLTLHIQFDTSISWRCQSHVGCLTLKCFTIIIFGRCQSQHACGIG